MSALAYIFYALPFLVMLILGLLLPILVVWASRSMTAGMGLIAVFFLMDAAFPETFSINLGIHWYLADLSFGLVAMTTLARLMFVPDARQSHGRALWLFVIVVSINIVHGLLVYKGAAGVAARPNFYALVAALYVFSFPLTADRLRGLFLVGLWCAMGLLLLACFRLFVVALDIRALLPPSGSFQPPGSSIWRVIVSDQALLLADAALALWFFASNARMGSWRWLAPFLMMMVIGLQHRSVWLASIMGLAVVMLSRSRSGRGGWGQSLAVVVFVVVVAGAAGLAGSGGGLGGGLGGDIAKSAGDAVALRGTADERLGSWRQLVKNWVGEGPRAWAIGVPFGTSLERYTSDDFAARRIAYQPHNYFVETLVTQGVVGIAALLWAYGLALRAAWRGRLHPELGDWSRWLLMLLACQLTYFLTYGVAYLQTLALGAGLALAARLRTEQLAALAPLATVAGRGAAARASRPLAMTRGH